MLFQFGEATIWYIIWLVLATIIVALILYIAVRLVDSKLRASDKKWMILLIAFIMVLIIPLIVGAITMVLGVIGDLLAGLRTLLYPSGQNFLVQLAPVIAFLFLFLLVKFLITDSWEHSIWISLITFFFLFLIYCVLPELYNYTGVGL